MSRGDNRGAYAQLEQSLMAPEGDLQVTTGTPMMEVVAPATLSEGYAFDVDVNGKTVQVKVPAGGVEEGQKFTIAMPADSDSLQVGLPRIHVPVGQWKDGLCNCCNYGVCHNHIWVSCLCHLIGAGQVITRLQLNWLGRPGSLAETTGAFWILFYITSVYWASYLILGFAVGPLDTTSNIPVTTIIILVIRDLLWYAYLGLSIAVIYNLRKYTRQRYAIPEHEWCPTGCEDAWCAVCCSCLTVAQMLRHTTDYDTYHSSCCCTETGVPSNIPSIV